MKSLIVVSTILLSACATTGGGSFFDPEVSSGNARFVSIYDPIGIPGKGMQMASSHCSNHGRTAVPRGRAAILHDIRVRRVTLQTPRY